MLTRNQNGENQPDPVDSTPKDISQDNGDANNFVRKCLVSHFDSDTFSKFQQVLDYVGQKLYKPVYEEFNNNLRKSLQNSQFAPVFNIQQYIQLKAKCYSFCFINQIGDLLLVRLNGSHSENAEKNFLRLAKILLYHSLTAKTETANLALVELQQLSLKLNLTLQSLYYKYRQKFLKVIIKAILQKLMTTTDGESPTNVNSSTTNTSSSTGSSNSKSNIVILYMTRAFEVFNIITINGHDVAQSLIITTILLHKEVYNDTIKQFLEHLASYHSVDTFTLLRNHIHTILISLLLKRKLSHLDMMACVDKLCSFCDKKPKDLVNPYKIKGRLMLHYATNPKIVTEGIYFISKFEDDQPFEEELDDESTFVEYLEPTLVGILLGIDEHFTATKAEFGSEDSIMQVRGLGKFLNLLSMKHVAAIRVKLLSTLASLVNIRPSSSIQDLDLAILDCWVIFASRLNDTMKSEIAVNICVTLFDMIEDYADQIALIYNELLLKNEAPTLKETLRSLFFLPDTPQFKKIYDIITPEVKRDNKLNNLVELDQHITYTIPLLEAENQKCRHLGISKIKDLLTKNQGLLLSSELTHLEEPLHPTIAKIIGELLKFCCQMDKKSSSILAQCLGIIGAINPVRFEPRVFGSVEKKTCIISNLTESSFIIELIELLKTFIYSDKSRESESASYALQVISLHFPISTSDKYKLRLSNEGLRAIELSQKTRYSGVKRFQPDFSTTIYEGLMNKGNFSYKDWIDKFSHNLISTIKTKKVQEVLNACSYVFRYNLQLAEFLLPYAIIHLITNQPANVAVIKKEFLAIVEQDIGISTQDLDRVRDQDHDEDNLQTLLVQCANIVFKTLDLVHRLDCETRQTQDKHRTVRLDQYQKDTLREFADCIPKDKLAMLAAKCRTHVRALYYFDQYLFEKKSDLNKYATALQRIYVALDDHFDAAGIEMVRTTPMTIIDDVSNYEAIGRFDKAFTCCTTALNSLPNGPDREALIDDSLKCLSNQGDFQRLHDRTKRLLDDEPQSLRRNIMPFAIEAAWKLGKWDQLENYHKSSENLDLISEYPTVGMGKLLSCLIKSKLKVETTLESVRRHFIKPLSIAMIDQSAYFRGYENLLSLHCLEDFGMCAKLLKEIPDTIELDENNMDECSVHLDQALSGLFGFWANRNRIVQPSLLSQEQTIQWHRSICSVIAKKYPFLSYKINIHVGTLWLQSANVAREARSFDRSFDCLTQARHWFGSEFDLLSMDLRVKYHLERAKLHWDQGDQTKAIRGLKHTLGEFKDHKLYAHLRDKKRTNVASDVFPNLNDLNDCDTCAKFEKSERESLSQLEMLLTQYSEESAAAIPETLFFMYERCVHLGVDREETYFRLARYYDKLVVYYMENPSLCGSQSDVCHQTQFGSLLSQNAGGANSSEDICMNLMEHSIMAFGNSLRYGAKHLRESMPRMLNIWYDLGSRKTEENDRRKKGSDIRSSTNMRQTLDRTTKFIAELKDKHIPPYYFMSAISIILSSACHPIAVVAKKTSEILELLLSHYPHQLTWLLLALMNDTDNRDRAAAARSILFPQASKGRNSTSKMQQPAVTKIISNTIQFSQILCALSINYTPKDNLSRPDHNRKKLVGHCSIDEFTDLAGKFKFADTRVLAPIQATINAIIPMDVASGKNPNAHVIFPEHNMSFVRGFDDDVRVFNSLQQPRQVKLKCDNGLNVSVICKYGDDMRKDSRCIEFLNLLNIILRRDSQSNLRFMDIQTFLVLPLRNDVGIIEMVPNCEACRHLIDPLYKERKTSFNLHEQIPRERGRSLTAEQALHLFETIALPKTRPPVFPTWFLRRFTEPTAWYMARLAFTRSAAVASMGGYIIGLGDRHLDNILVETSTGKIVHVDFNLLFHQGELLNVPERVPFRLTQNFIAAFGPMGTEGNFRKVCEIAMRVMRKEKDAMLTTLKPFIHDPCTEWMKSVNGRNRIDEAEKHPAKQRIEVTERKLKGFPRSMHFKPLTMIDTYSVEAQVDNLISEAADNANLAQMYFGWCPHI